MKRGKRFFKNDNLYIYVGTAIFFILAIALGIILYMMNRTAVKLQTPQVIQESQIAENSESVSTEIGKTIQEQEKMENNLSENTDGLLDEKSTSNSTDLTKSENIINNVKTNTNLEESEKIKNEKTGVNQVDEPDIKEDSNVGANDDAMETKEEITFVKPTDGEVISEYAKDNLIYSETLKEWITHTAIDLKADKTSVIKAAADGVVKSIVNDPRYGLTVVIQHDEGYETVYANLLTAEFVVVGEEVSQGQTIGTAGNTASFESCMESHLHFELLKDGEYLNPSIYLK